jgi:hypothetical protein
MVSYLSFGHIDKVGSLAVKDAWLLSRLSLWERLYTTKTVIEVVWQTLKQ